MLLNLILSIIIIPGQLVIDSAKPSETEYLSGPVSIRSDSGPVSSLVLFITTAMAVILLCGFTGGLLFAAVYNFLAKRIGGIKFDSIECIEKKDPEEDKNIKNRYD